MKSLVFNVYKPPGLTSYDVLRHFKRHLPRPFGKIGHFGTLDPFAEGVLLVGIGSATRLNEFVHEYLPKTYLATGRLGVQTETGDLTVAPKQTDDGAYLNDVVAKFDKVFIDERLKKKFLGDYLQAPPAFSAAKFKGRPLHEWAREGVTVVKEKKERHIYSLDVVEYAFPLLTIRVTVSSGTYIRSLFEDCANVLGTIGALEKLVRTSIGHISQITSLKNEHWPAEGRVFDSSEAGIPVEAVLPLNTVLLSLDSSARYRNGMTIRPENFKLIINEEAVCNDKVWVHAEGGDLLGLGRMDEGLRPQLNFCLE